MNKITSKTEFLDALRRAMSGIAPEAAAKTLAYYEQRFVDEGEAGRSEAEIAAELDDPKKIALTLRANTHLASFQENKTPFNFGRMLVSGVGLLIFNFFMIVPAAVFASMLLTLYVSGVGIYIAGVLITGFGLAGANEIVFDKPGRHVLIIDEDKAGAEAESKQARITIGLAGIQFQNERDQSKEMRFIVAPRAGAEHPVGQRGTELIGGRGWKISGDMDSEERSLQTAGGLGFVIAGILLFLLSLVVTKYTLLGIKRYVMLNISILKGN